MCGRFEGHRSQFGRQFPTSTHVTVQCAPRWRSALHKIVILTRAVLVTSANAQDKPKLAKVRVRSDSVFVDGIWRPDNLNKESELTETATSYSCFQHGGESVAGADGWCLEADASAPYGMLTVALPFCLSHCFSRSSRARINCRPAISTSRESSARLATRNKASEMRLTASRM